MSAEGDIWGIYSNYLLVICDRWQVSWLVAHRGLVCGLMVWLVSWGLAWFVGWLAGWLLVGGLVSRRKGSSLGSLV